jgi:hypothetical protein
MRPSLWPTHNISKPDVDVPMARLVADCRPLRIVVTCVFVPSVASHVRTRVGEEPPTVRILCWSAEEHIIVSVLPQNSSFQPPSRAGVLTAPSSKLAAPAAAAALPPPVCASGSGSCAGGAATDCTTTLVLLVAKFTCIICEGGGAGMRGEVALDPRRTSKCSIFPHGRTTSLTRTDGCLRNRAEAIFALSAALYGSLTPSGAMWKNEGIRRRRPGAALASRADASISAGRCAGEHKCRIYMYYGCGLH